MASGSIEEFKKAGLIEGKDFFTYKYVPVKRMTLTDFKGVFEYLLQREMKEKDNDLFIEMMMDSCNYYIMRENEEGFAEKYNDLTSFLLDIKKSYATI